MRWFAYSGGGVHLTVLEIRERSNSNFFFFASLDGYFMSQKDHSFRNVGFQPFRAAA